MGFYGSKVTVPGMRPWAYLRINSYAECELCTWVWNPHIGTKELPFTLKFINRMCPQHGKKLPD